MLVFLHSTLDHFCLYSKNELIAFCKQCTMHSFIVTNYTCLLKQLFPFVLRRKCLRRSELDCLKRCSQSKIKRNEMRLSISNLWKQMSFIWPGKNSSSNISLELSMYFLCKWFQPYVPALLIEFLWRQFLQTIWLISKAAF